MAFLFQFYVSFSQIVGPVVCGAAVASAVVFHCRRPEFFSHSFFFTWPITAPDKGDKGHKLTSNHFIGPVLAAVGGSFRRPGGGPTEADYRPTGGR